MDIEAVDIASMRPAVKTPVEDILKQHRKRFVLHTARGDVVVKYLSYRSRQAIDTIRYSKWPELYDLESEFRELAPLAELADADDDIRKRTGELVCLIRPTLDIYSLACIMTPELESVEDLDTMMGMLTPDEAYALQSILLLATARPGDVDMTYLEVAERFNVSVVDRELLDDMTSQQADILHGILVAERNRERDLYKKMGVQI
jgi:hypothetical protein